MKFIWIIIAVVVWVLLIYFSLRLLKNAMTDQLPDPPENICLLETHGWDACGCEQCFERGGDKNEIVLFVSNMIG